MQQALKRCFSEKNVKNDIVAFRSFSPRARPSSSPCPPPGRSPASWSWRRTRPQTKKGVRLHSFFRLLHNSLNDIFLPKNNFYLIKQEHTLFKDLRNRQDLQRNKENWLDPCPTPKENYRAEMKQRNKMSFGIPPRSEFIKPKLK